MTSKSFIFPYFLIVIASFSSYSLAQQRDLTGSMNFDGRYIVSTSDADMIGSAYVNGKLGPEEGTDTLSVIPLAGDPRDWSAVEIIASNSVAGPPAVLDLSPDGRYAFVIETFKQRPENIVSPTFRDLKVGDRLQVFDLIDPNKPVLTSDLVIPTRPLAIRMNSDGSLLAITFHKSGAGSKTPLGLFPVKDGVIGTAVYPEIAEWDNTTEMIDIDWHPEKNILAILNRDASNLRFVSVTASLAAEVLGNIVGIEKEPFRVEFTPDGRHVVVNGLYWGKDIQGHWTEAPRGSVLTVRMNANSNNQKTRHAMISTIKTGVSPEGLAVSPDGKWVVTTNLERSYLPYNDKRITWFSSLTLARLDEKTGQLIKIGDFAYDGILPEAAVFDNSSNFIAVATYDHFDDRKKGGSIDFWRIDTDPLDASRTHLVKTEYSVDVARGPHSMVIAR
ncbi:MAG: hypothetical protein ABJN40_02105 [Sneathiella sp.]